MARWFSVLAFLALFLFLAWASCAASPAPAQVLHVDGAVIRGHFPPGAGPVGPSHYCRDADCRARREAARCLEDLACIVAEGRRARAALVAQGGQ
jgi:hypothetical protein